MGFSGEFPCALEERFRTTFPSRWRELLRAEQGAPAAGEGAEKLQLFLTKGPQGGLWGFTPQAWERFSGKLVAQLKGVSVLNKEAAMLRHLFLAPAQEVQVDRHGRMLVPEALRSFAALDGEAVWVGSGPYFELYGRARWQLREAEIAESLRTGDLATAAEKFQVTVD